MHLLVFDRGATMFSLRRCANVTLSGPPPYDRTYALQLSADFGFYHEDTFAQLLGGEWSRTGLIRIPTC